MLTGFFFTLRQAGVPVALNEWLQLMAALQAGVAETSVDAFHSLARTVLVKDERYYDRYDLAFGKYFQGWKTCSLLSTPPGCRRTGSRVAQN